MFESRVISDWLLSAVGACLVVFVCRDIALINLIDQFGINKLSDSLTRVALPGYRRFERAHLTSAHLGRFSTKEYTDLSTSTRTRRRRRNRGTQKERRKREKRGRYSIRATSIEGISLNASLDFHVFFHLFTRPVLSLSPSLALRVYPFLSFLAIPSLLFAWEWMLLQEGEHSFSREIFLSKVFLCFGMRCVCRAYMYVYVCACVYTRTCTCDVCVFRVPLLFRISCVWQYLMEWG